ncbi:RNA polymerase sigma factor [Chryseobacterium arachidis]|nr:sigma-70 family RNA polymerase sigma factor [Chryseobacterium arachidis]
MMQNNSNLDWQKVYSNYSPKLLGICRRYIQDIYTAEDIVQDSFITAIQKNHQLHDEKALFAWLKKIVVNNALQHIRSHSKDTFVTTEPSEIPDMYSEMENQTLEEKNIFIYDFTNEELLSSIDNLPPHHKSVFNLYFIENHSHAEISSLLGITVNTSKSHLLRAKKSVQNYLLNNFVNHNTPKKKMAQLLVIFGLGGLLWAQTFQNKFAQFKIQPLKKLEIPSDHQINNSGFSSSNQAWKKKLMIGGTLLIIAIASVFLLNTRNSLISNNSSVPINKNQIGINPIQARKNEKKSNPNREKNPVGQHINEPHSTHNDLQNVTESKEKEQSLVIKKNLKKTIIKDSVHEPSQKVIVVKKIVRRDTIFVEK